MAEVFGVVAGVVGFVPILLQLKAGIDILRETRDAKDKIPAEVAKLATDLELLLFFLEPVLSSTEVGEGILRICIDRCARVAEDLEVIKAKLSETAHRKGLSVRRVTAYQGLKSDVMSLHKSITAAHAMVLGVSQTISITPTQLHLSKDQLPVEASNGRVPHRTAQLPLEPTQHASIATSLPRYTGSVVRPAPRRSCFDGSVLRCACSCHQTTQVMQRLLSVDYTPVRTITKPCSKKFCQNRYVGASAKLDLVNLGLWWSVTIGAFVAQEAGSFSLRPSLVVKKTVPFGSLSFRVLRSLQNNTESVVKVQNRLLELSRDDPSLRHQLTVEHVLLDQLHDFPGAGLRTDPRLAVSMLRFLITELHVPIGFHQPRFLYSLPGLSNINGHYRIDEFMSLGLDPGDCAAPGEQWKLKRYKGHALIRGFPTSQNGDPFHVKFLQTICQHSYALDWMSPLHRAVLCGSTAEFDRSLKASGLNPRNGMGQTPLHLSILNGKHVSALIDAGHNIDAMDQRKKRPLEYAVAYGMKDVVMILLEAGADWSLDSGYYPSTIQCAMKSIMVSKDASIIFDMVSKIRSMTDVKTSQKWARVATIEFFRDGSLSEYRSYSHWMGEYTTLAGFLSVCGSPNFDQTGETVEPGHHGSTLMHHMTTAAQVRGLVDHGFNLINNVDLSGESALSRAIRDVSSSQSRDTELFRALLEAGTDVNVSIERGRPVIFWTLSRFQERFATPEAQPILYVLDTLLEAGADCHGHDTCLCSCSPGGCQPISAFNKVIRKERRRGENDPRLLMQYELAKLEWLSLVDRHRGRVDARDTLASFIRELKHEELGMTHVCCSLYRDALDRDAALEIVEEESDFIDLLDGEMSDLEGLEFQALLEVWYALLRVVYGQQSADSPRQGPLEQFLEPMIRYKFFMAYLRCTGDAASRDGPPGASSGESREEASYTARLSRLISLAAAFGFDVGDLARKAAKTINNPDQVSAMCLKEIRDKGKEDEFRTRVLSWDVAKHQRETDRPLQDTFVEGKES